MPNQEEKDWMSARNRELLKTRFRFLAQGLKEIEASGVTGEEAANEISKLFAADRAKNLGQAMQVALEAIDKFGEN